MISVSDRHALALCMCCRTSKLKAEREKDKKKTKGKGKGKLNIAAGKMVDVTTWARLRRLHVSVHLRRRRHTRHLALATQLLLALGRLGAHPLALEGMVCAALRNREARRPDGAPIGSRVARFVSALVCCYGRVHTCCADESVRWPDDSTPCPLTTAQCARAARELSGERRYSCTAESRKLFC